MGELVYKLDSSTTIGQSRKSQPIFLCPYVITEVLSPVLYQIEGRRKSIVVHHDGLILCRDSIPFWLRAKRHEHLLGGELRDENSMAELGAEEADGDVGQEFVGELLGEEEEPLVMELGTVGEGERGITDTKLGEAEEEGEGEGIETQEVCKRVATRSGRTVNRPAYLRCCVM